MSPVQKFARTLVAILLAMPLAWYLLGMGGLYRGPGEVRWGWVPLNRSVAIELPPLDLQRATTVRHELAGVPLRKMSLEFDVSSPRPGSGLSWSQTQIDVTIRESNDGRLVCSASGKPRPDDQGRRWILMGDGRGDQSFWHHDCRDEHFNPFTRYVLEIHIVPDAEGPSAMVTPVLGSKRINWTF